MADEQNLPQEEAQAPESPVIADRADYFKIAAASKDFIKKYGYTDYNQFRNMLFSDAHLAQMVFDDLFAEKFGIGEPSKGVGVLPDAPQELNITGKLDHTEDVAKRVVTEATDTQPPPVVADAHPEGTSPEPQPTTEEVQ